MVLGVVMLDTRFTRYPGDIGHEKSHAGPVLFETVPGASAARVVGGMSSLVDPADREAALVPFIAAARQLVARGARAITTSCGFLASYQDELSAALDVPVITSALCLLPEIDRTLPAGKRIGVLTFSAQALGEPHFRGVRYEKPVAISGLRPDSHFRNAILERSRNDSFARREADVLDAAERLLASAPDLGAVVLECTNFPPHRAMIEARIGLAVFDIWDATERLCGHGRLVKTNGD